MKPKFFCSIALVAAIGVLSTSYARAQSPPFTIQLLNVQLSKTVSRVVDSSGIEVRVWCDYSLNPDSTRTASQGRDAWVSPVRCAQAEALARGVRPGAMAKAKREFAQALVLLLRAGNMAVGIGDLDIAVCKAIQQTEFLAEELGVGHAYGRDLAVLAWKFTFKPDGCRPGGPLDFHLGQWPEPSYGPPQEADGKG